MYRLCHPVHHPGLAAGPTVAITPHLFSAFLPGEAGVKVSWHDSSPRVILSPDGDPEGRDVFRAHCGEEGAAGTELEKSPCSPTFQLCRIIPVLAFPWGLPVFPVTGTRPTGTEGKVTWYLGPRLQDSLQGPVQGCRGTRGDLQPRTTGCP